MCYYFVCNCLHYSFDIVLDNNTYLFNSPKLYVGGEEMLLSNKRNASLFSIKPREVAIPKLVSNQESYQARVTILIKLKIKIFVYIKI